MPDYETKIGISVDTSELDDAEKRINDLVNKKQTIKIDTSGSVKNIDDITDSVKNAQKSTSSFGDMFKKALGIGTYATLAAKSIRLIGKAAKEALSNVKVLDKSMTELRKVTDETPQTYKKILSDASTTAKEIGTSINGLIDSTADFARLGYSIGDSQQLAKTANIYAQIGDGVSSVDAATKSIISTMAAFNIGASDSIKIVDKFNEVGNKYAISSGGIGAALERSASSMAAAGNSLDQSIALITAANTVVQNPESIGTAFKTITMRIRGAKTELEDAGLSTEGMATSVSKLRDEIRVLSGVDIMQNDSTFKSTYQIMDELSQKWKELSDIQKASITELIAGKRQGNIVSSLMENFDIARNALDSSLNSDGSAMAEHAKWRKSIEARTNQLKAAFESLSVNTISSDIVGGIVQATTALVTLLDKTNLVKTSLAGLVAYGGIKGFAAIASGIVSAATAMDKFNTALTIAKAANIGKSQFDQLVQITTTLSASQAKAIITAKALSTEQRMAILTARGMSQAEAEAALSAMGLSTAEGAATASTLSLKGAFKGLMATIKPFAPLIIGATVAFATFKAMQYYSFDGFYQRATEAQAALTQTNDNIAKTTSLIEENKQKIKELKEQKATTFGSSLDGLNAEISKLEQENVILEQKKKLYEEMQKIEQQKAAESAAKALTQTDLYDTTVYNPGLGIYEDSQTRRTILENVQADIAKAKELQIALDNNAKSIANIDTSTKEGQKQFRRLSDRRSSLQAALAKTQTSVNQQKESILNLYSALFDSDGNIISGYEGFVKEIQGIFPELVATAEETGNAVASAATSVVEATIASIKESVSKTKSLIASISDIQSLASKQKAGFSISDDDLNAEGVREYASALEYVNGVYQLNTQKVGELVKAKAKEQIANNQAAKAMSQSQYLENARQIESLRALLNGNSAYRENNSQAIRAQIADLLNQNATLRDNCQSIDMVNASLAEATSAYQNWINAQSAAQSGDMFDDTLKAIQQINDTLNNKQSDLFGRVGRTDYQAALEFVIPETVDSTDAAAINKYLNSISSMFTYKNGERSGLNIENFCKQAVNAGLMVLNDAGTEYQIVGGKTMEDFAKGMNLAMPLVRAMFGEMQEFGGVFDWSDEAEQTFGDIAMAANEAREALLAISDNQQYGIKIDISDIPDAQGKIDALDKTIAEMQTLKAKIGVDPSEVEHANDIIKYCVAQKQLLCQPDIMMVDTSVVEGDLGRAIETLQNFQDARNKLGAAQALGIDTSQAQAELDAATQAVQNLDANITSEKALNIDTSDIDSIAASLDALTADLIVKAGIDDSAVIGYQQEERNADATVTWDNETSAVDAYAAAKKYANGIINWSNNTSLILTHVTATGTIYWSNSYSGSGGRSRVTGTANVSGTAYAGGNWGNKSSGKALVGEEGREIVVDPHTGRWYTVGDNGAEFRDIPRGAIVFNHRQTESLLQNGYTSGRATALASGTALVSGGISVGNAHNSIVSGGSSSYKPPANSVSSASASSSNSSSSSDKEPEWMDWVEIAISRVERLVKKLKDAASSAFKSLRSKFEATSDAIEMITKDLEVQSRAYTRYISQANSVGLSPDIAAAVQNGAIDIRQYDEDTQKKIQQYEEWYNKALECSDAIDELKNSLAELNKQKFDSIEKNFSNRIEQITYSSNAILSKIDALEEKGYLDSISLYNSLAESKRSEIEMLNQEYKSLTSAMNGAMSSGEIEKDSEAWYEMNNQILDVKEELDKANISLIEYKNTIRDIEWDYFDFTQKRIAELSNEANFLIDLMSGKDLYTDNGQLSETGLATVGLHSMNYNTYMNQADQYAAEVKKLNAEIAKDPNNTKLTERREELLGLQRDSINAAKQEKQAIVDMVENGIDVQLDSMQELIEKYNDALDSAKDFNDYQKKVRDQTSEIGNLNKQLAAYMNDDSEETRAAVQKLQVELQKAQEELDETEYDQFITDQKKLLDELYDEYETSMNQRLDNIDALIEDMIGSINSNSGAINDTLHDIAKKNGYTLSDDMNSIWSSSAFTLNNTVSVYGDDFKEKLTGISYVLDRIQDNTSAMATNSNSGKYLYNDIPAFASGGLAKHTGLAHLDGTPSKPELVLNPKDTDNFLAIIEEVKRRQGNELLVGSTLPYSMKQMPQIAHSIGSVDIERKLGQIISQTSANGGDTTTTFGDINIHIDHVQDYNDFVRQLQHDDEFERMIHAMTTNRYLGRSSLEKYRCY